MTTSQKKIPNRLSDFLTQQELFQIEQIAKDGGAHRQHAMAILSLNQGLTQNQAASKAGLTRWQVKYWIGKFRDQRMDIFPESLIKISPNDNLLEVSNESLVTISDDQKSNEKKIKTGKKLEKSNTKKSNGKMKNKKKKNKKRKKQENKTIKEANTKKKKLKKGVKNKPKKNQKKRKKKK